jgi:hypothetical protein
MKKYTGAILLLLACLLLIAASGATAQLRESGVAVVQPTYAVPANYSIAKPGELTMQVNLWGYITHPGRYEVSITTDLVQLMSYAGGPTPDAKLDAVRITRFLKTEAGVSRAELVVNLEDLYRINDSQLILQPGDTIYLDRTAWVGIRDIISLVTTAAVVVATVATVISVVNANRTTTSTP